MVVYHNEDITFLFKGKRLNNRWLSAVASSEGKRLCDLSIVFCSDSYLLDINKRFLQHDYYTDIITFDYCEGERVSGDLLISVDSVRANSLLYDSVFADELDRVMVHGLLHLLGYDDHTPDDIAIMRSKEDHYVALKKQMLEG